MVATELGDLPLRADYEVRTLEAAEGGFYFKTMDGERRFYRDDQFTFIARPKTPKNELLVKIWVNTDRLPLVLNTKVGVGDAIVQSVALLLDRVVEQAQMRLDAGKEVQGDGWALTSTALAIEGPEEGLFVPREVIEGITFDSAGGYLVCRSGRGDAVQFLRGGRNVDLLGPLLGWSDKPAPSAPSMRIKPSDYSKAMPLDHGPSRSLSRNVEPSALLKTETSMDRRLAELSEGFEEESGSDLGRLIYDDTASRLSGAGVSLLLAAVAVVVVGSFGLFRFLMRVGVKGQNMDVVWKILAVGIPIVVFLTAAGIVFLAMPPRRTQLFSRGVRVTGGLMSAFEVAIREIKAMQFILQNYERVGASAYWTMKLELAGGQLRTCEAALKIGHEADLMEARSTLALPIGERMLKKLRNGKTVRWTPLLKLRPDGVETPRGLIAYEEIQGARIVVNRWIALSVRGKEVFEELTSERNFYPGLHALEAMTGRDLQG
jgi:hypothetical protein